MAFSFTGCGYEAEEENVLSAGLPGGETEVDLGASAAEDETAESSELPQSESEPEPSVSEGEATEEEKIEAVCGAGMEMTFCIFTPNGNNGTGFLYKEKYVITNAHVLYEADAFTLVDFKGQEHKGAVIFEDDGTDIAIIQVDDCQGGSVEFGDSDSVSVGESVVLIGNPVDGEPFSFCTGKRVELGEKLHQQLNLKDLYIPLDANIVSGYSGGPVFNLDGKLIGISNAAFLGDLSAYNLKHLSLIIPINRVMEQIETNCQ